MHLGVVGTRNHAARMIRLAGLQDGVAQITAYHPDPERLAAASLDAAIVRSSTLADLLDCDAVIVAAPHASHADYIVRLIDDVPYVLCEKPPASTRDQLAMLRALPAHSRGRLAFNFNYARSAFVEAARERLADGRLGAPVYASFTATHGLAFKDAFADNWRLADADPFSGILGNLGIHYLHAVIDLFGGLSEAQLTPAQLAPNARVADTVSLALGTVAGPAVHIHLSYAAPYVNQARLIFTDGMLDLDDGAVRELTPRDSFDENGRFATPPAHTLHASPGSKVYYDAAISAVLADFVDVARRGARFDERAFELAIASAKAVLDLAEA